MAYNVGTPRFYINDLTFGAAHGITTLDAVGDGNPSNAASFTLDGTATAIQIGNYNMLNYERPNYFAVLGHNLASVNAHIRTFYSHDLVAYSWNGGHPQNGIVNSTNDNNPHDNGSHWGRPLHDGFSIIELTGASDDGTYLVVKCRITSLEIGTVNIGAFFIGRFYDMPHSPDLSLSMSREYGGIKTIETKGGASLSNAFYTKPPLWGNGLGAWELYDPFGDDPATEEVETTFAQPPPLNQALSRSGRRTWDLSFSFLDDSDVFGSNQSLSLDSWLIELADGTPPASAFDTEDLQDDNSFTYNILTDPSFYAQVIHRTNGGQLPFIFQPDNNDNTNFALCKFDMKSFKFKQVANGVYDMKLKIREVW